MKKGLVIWIFICFSVLLCTATTVRAATPRVMVSDYKVKEEKVIAGEEFTLDITLKNTAQRAVKNLKLTVRAENGEMLPTQGAGTDYSEQIDADSEQTFSFRMKAINGLEEKAYKLSVKIEYENTGGWEYTVEETLFIPVSMNTRISLSDYSTEKWEAQLGDTVELFASVNNLGAGTVYNVTARLIGDTLGEADHFIGNIESGKSGGIDILTRAVHVTDEDHTGNRIVVSYEDKEGNVYQEEMLFQFTVKKPEYKNLEKVKDGPDNSAVIRMAGRGLVLAATVCILIVLFYRRKKHKQKLLEEFME